MLNIAVLVSGGGTTLQSIIDSVDSGLIQNGRIVRVISSKPGVFSLERASKHNIPSIVVARKEYDDIVKYTDKICGILQSDSIDLIVLAGFLTILDKSIVEQYKNRIINTHSALIPSFCGKGYYGLKVHQAVIDYGVKITGATVHFVNEITDGGPIILQKAVEVMENDTAETLQKRVLEQCEHDILPKAVALFCQGRLDVIDNKVKIKY